MGFPGGSAVKNSPADAGDAGDRFNSCIEQIPLERETATHSNILAWKIPWTEELGGLSSMGSQKSDTI